MEFSTLFTSSVVAAVVTFALSNARQWMSDGKRTRGFLRGMLLDLDHAARCGQAYLKDAERKQVWSPAYRVETEFLRKGLPILTELHALNEAEQKAIHVVLVHADEANRCLERLMDLVEKISHKGKTMTDEERHSYSRALKETARTKRKFRHLRDEVPLAITAVHAALKRHHWYEQT